jgi:hypothetical protein
MLCRCLRWMLPCLLLPGLLLAGIADAAVTRFEITSRTVVADGQSFGNAGPYERIVGRVYYRVDPTTTANRAIVDLPLAPRTADGQVEFWAELDVLTPQDPTKANGAILYDVNNRGNKLALRMFNDTAGPSSGPVGTPNCFPAAIGCGWRRRGPCRMPARSLVQCGAK